MKYHTKAVLEYVIAHENMSKIDNYIINAANNVTKYINNKSVNLLKYFANHNGRQKIMPAIKNIDTKMEQNRKMKEQITKQKIKRIPSMTNNQLKNNLNNLFSTINKELRKYNKATVAIHSKSESKNISFDQIRNENKNTIVRQTLKGEYELFKAIENEFYQRNIKKTQSGIIKEYALALFEYLKNNPFTNNNKIKSVVENIKKDIKNKGSDVNLSSYFSHPNDKKEMFPAIKNVEIKRLKCDRETTIQELEKYKKQVDTLRIGYNNNDNTINKQNVNEIKRRINEKIQDIKNTTIDPQNMGTVETLDHKFNSSIVFFIAKNVKFSRFKHLSKNEIDTELKRLKSKRDNIIKKYKAIDHSSVTGINNEITKYNRLLKQKKCNITGHLRPVITPI